MAQQGRAFRSASAESHVPQTASWGHAPHPPNGPCFLERKLTPGSKSLPARRAARSAGSFSRKLRTLPRNTAEGLSTAA